MGSGRGRKAEESQAKKQAETAYNQYTEDPLEKLNRERTMKFITDFDSGKDVKDMSGVSPYLDLFNSARNSQANQQIGTGAVALGQNPNAERGQLSDIDRVTQARREQDAAGMLYNTVNQAYGDAMGQSQYLINTSQNRAANKAGLATNWYQTLVGRPQQTPLWERIAGLAIGGAGAISGFRR